MFGNLFKMRRFAGILTALLVLSLLGGCKKLPEPKKNSTVEAGSALMEASASEVTNEQRSKMFDFARTYYLSMLPDFSEGEKPDFSRIKWYAAALHRDALIENEDGTVSVPGSVLEQVASELFGVTYGIKPEETVTLDIGTYAEKPMAQLVSYRATPLDDGGHRVAVTLKTFSIPEFLYQENPEEYEFHYDPSTTYAPATLAVYEEMQRTGLRFYEAARQLIVTGRTEALGDAESLTHLVLYMKDADTFGQFIASYRATYEGNGTYYYPPDFEIPA